MRKNIAWIDDVFVITVLSENAATLLESGESPVIYWEKQQKYFSLKIDQPVNVHAVCMVLYEELPIGEELMLMWGDSEIPVYPGAVVRTDWFDRNYAAENAQFGAVYQPLETDFSVWAPTAISVTLCLDAQEYKLMRTARGVWHGKIAGDWHGYPYQYKAAVNGETVQVNDPYAKAMLANSEKSVVIDLAKTNPADFKHHERPAMTSLQDAIIYELHVRDATAMSDSGVRHKGKFSGLAEKKTVTSCGYSTGLSYIKELGVTHVQLLPVNDFARVDEQKPEKDYNWGYDPLYFQVPEGSYATAADTPVTRIAECKQMIQSFHEEGIAVILDVVYNHVYIMESSPFEKLLPGYFFRYDGGGNPSNGTGVGNDFASERLMARKFILDTIDFWLTEYQVDGFRFDLMGALDVKTMQDIAGRCRLEDQQIMLLGEGWELATAISSEDMATSRNSGKLAGIRFFNDLFRDSLKGNLFGEDPGYVNGHGRFIERLPHLVSGSALASFGQPFVSDVNQTVNYVECHDNHTLWDRLARTNAGDTEEVRRKMHELATGLTLLSQGVPFIHAGQEWFRTKQGDGNSYLSGDQVNQLDWHQRETETDYIRFVQSLIALRKRYGVFRFSSKQEIQRRLHILDTPHPVFGFSLLGDREDFSIYINPGVQQHDLTLASTGRWQLMVTNSSEREKTGQEINGEFMSIHPYEFIVIKKSFNK